MRIGIDLDDTIFSTSEQYRKYQKEFTDYSSYYIKEIEAGKGYKLDENLYEFEISTNNTNIKLNNKN